MSIELDERGRALENEYFHRQEKQLIEKMKSKLGAANSTSDALQCPKCEGNLIETDHENIKIDVCDNCTGVWLDAGELAQIVQKDSTNKGWFSRILD